MARHIAETKKKEDGLVVVTGLSERTAEGLEERALKMGGDVPESEMNALLSAGDQQTAALLAIALQEEGIPAQSVTGFKSGVVTNRYRFKDRINEINTDRVEEIVESGRVAVVAGFQTTEGGSDVTAVGTAAYLGWDCDIYTEDMCMYTVDPQVYPEAKPIKAVTYEEMMEMANLGADKIETKAVELAKKYSVKLFFGKSLEDDRSKGTYIVSKEMIINENLLVEDTPVTGMGIQDEVSIFTLRNLASDGKAVAEVFRILGEQNIIVDMISQQMAENGTCTVSFSCGADQGEALTNEIGRHEIFDGITIDCEGNLAMISLVGVGMAANSGVASEVFRILAENNIKYYHITTSEISISVTVEMGQKLNAAIALCRAFNL